MIDKTDFASKLIDTIQLQTKAINAHTEAVKHIISALETNCKRVDALSDIIKILSEEIDKLNSDTQTVEGDSD